MTSDEDRISKETMNEKMRTRKSMPKTPFSNTSLSEAREKLNRLRPETLGQASRIAGIKPSDIASIAIALTK